MADSSILPRCHIVNLEHSLVFLAMLPAFNIVLSNPISDYTEGRREKCIKGLVLKSEETFPFHKGYAQFTSVPFSFSFLNLL